MITIRLSSFLKLDIKPFIYGAFLSRTMEDTKDGKNYFYTYTRFKSSKLMFSDDFPIDNYSKNLINALNKQSGYHNWEIHSASKTCMEVRFYILKDIDMTQITFSSILYKKLMQEEWVMSDSPTSNEKKKSFIRGFMELRGSVDTTRKLIAQDYFYNTKKEIKKAQILTDLMGLPVEYANFNARDLQPQFVSGENRRNSQFRINSFYYANKIGFINEYKASIFEKAYHAKGKIIINDIIYFDVDIPKSKNDDVFFLKYLNFYTNNIYQKKLTEEMIDELRNRLNFEKSEPINSFSRNKNIITIFDKISEDKCAICGTTKTFLNKKDGRQYFEIHHVIPYYNGKELDNISNLVKLCPNCHDMLKKNRSTKENQLKAIIKILHEHDEIFDFTSTYLQIDDINKLAEKIWTMLG